MSSAQPPTRAQKRTDQVFALLAEFGAELSESLLGNSALKIAFRPVAGLATTTAAKYRHRRHNNRMLITHHWAITMALNPFQSYVPTQMTSPLSVTHLLLLAAQQLRARMVGFCRYSSTTTERWTGDSSFE